MTDKADTDSSCADDTPTIKPPPDPRTRATLPDIPGDALTAARKIRLETQDIIDSYIREREVVAMICLTDNLKRDSVKNTRMAITGDSLVFSEYSYQTRQEEIFYTYITPGHEAAGYSPLANIQPPLQHPDAGVLYRRKSGEATKEICRWDD